MSNTSSSGSGSGSGSGTSAVVVDIEEVTPGARFLWRAYRAGGDRVEIAVYRNDDGQLLWEPDAKKVKRPTPRAMSVLVGNRQVRVTRVDPDLRVKPPRIMIRYVDVALTPADPGLAVGGEKTATIALEHIIERLHAQHEVVDAVPE